MLDIERTIGRLEEQGRWTAKRIESIESKVDQLLAFKWRIYGATAVIALLVTSGLEIFWRIGK